MLAKDGIGNFGVFMTVMRKLLPILQRYFLSHFGTEDGRLLRSFDIP
jgi:hypothetical protein